MNINDFIIERIEELCKNRNMTHYRLSEKSGISQPSISNIIKGKNMPGLVILEKLCSGLGVTLSQFFAPNNDLPDLTTEQQEVLEIWDTLNDSQKIRLRSYIDGMTRK